jgi:Protein of unknown function (DUF3105)
MAERKSASRQRAGQFQKWLGQNLWLLIPISVVGLVVFLGLARGQRNRAGQVENFPLATAGTSLPTPSATASSLPSSPSNTEVPGTKFPDLGQEHVPVNQQPEYNSNPPTSGPHYVSQAEWGIHEQAPADGALVHNLEHGGIVISYNPDRVGGEELENLEIQARELSQINPRVIVTPRANLDAAIALTAWTYLQKLDNYDPDAVRAFYDAHIARGPECQDGQCPF